jgi:hypothetical protein
MRDDLSEISMVDYIQIDSYDMSRWIIEEDENVMDNKTDKKRL